MISRCEGRRKPSKLRKDVRRGWKEEEQRMERGKERERRSETESCNRGEDVERERRKIRA